MLYDVGDDGMAPGGYIVVYIRVDNETLQSTLRHPKQWGVMHGQVTTELVRSGL